jgi:hypothetical protein
MSLHILSAVRDSTWMLDRWLARLGGTTEIDLALDGQTLVPELLRVYTPNDFELRLLDGSWLRAKDGHVALELTAELVPLHDVAKTTGVIQRGLDTMARRAIHHKLELPESAQGEGRGRSLLRESVDLYAGLGIETVHLRAVDKGRYVWAAAGFAFQDEESRADVLRGLDVTTELLDLGLADLDPTTCEPWDIAYLPALPEISLRDALEVLSPELLEDPDLNADDLDHGLDRPGKLLLLADLVDGCKACSISGPSTTIAASKCSTITPIEMTPATNKHTKSSGLKGAIKHLSKTSPATARAMERHRERETAAGRPVAHLVKR